MQARSESFLHHRSQSQLPTETVPRLRGCLLDLCEIRIRLATEDPPQEGYDTDFDAIVTLAG